MADTTPNKVDPTTVEGYEPPVDGEDRKAAKARRARNRRRAEKVQREQAAADGKAEPSKVGRPSKAGKREQAVTGVLTGVGIAVMAFDEFDGTTIIEGAPDLAKALANLADKRPAVARALDAMTETSAWAEVAVAGAAIVVPIVTHHRQLAAERSAALDDPPPSAMAGAAPRDQPVPEPSAQTDPDAPVFTVEHPPDADPVPTFRA